MTLNAYSAIVIVAIFGCVTFLTYTSKIPAHTITALVGVVVGWLLKTGAVNVMTAVRARESAPPPPSDAKGKDKP